MSLCGWGFWPTPAGTKRTSTRRDIDALHGYLFMTYRQQAARVLGIGTARRRSGAESSVKLPLLILAHCRTTACMPDANIQRTGHLPAPLRLVRHKRHPAENLLDTGFFWRFGIVKPVFPPGPVCSASCADSHLTAPRQWPAWGSSPAARGIRREGIDDQFAVDLPQDRTGLRLSIQCVMVWCRCRFSRRLETVWRDWRSGSNQSPLHRSC